MLTYRGVKYEPTQIDFPTKPTNTFGVYRGVQIRFSQNAQRLDRSRSIPWTYRGVKYYAQG